MRAPQRWKHVRDHWAILGYYQRFESSVALVLTLLIALLALARKFIIILDPHELSPGHLLGLAAITLVLGVTFWLMRERDDRLADLSKDRRVSCGTVP